VVVDTSRARSGTSVEKDESALETKATPVMRMDTSPNTLAE